MSDLRVVVRATDPISALGLMEILDGRVTLVPMARLATADVLVCAVAEMDSTGFLALHALLDETPIRVVLVTNRLDKADLPQAVAAGVVAVVDRGGITARQLTGVVTAAGRDPVPVEVGETLVKLLRGVGRPRASLLLSERERTLLEDIAAGRNMAEIAVRLGYSERTVKNLLHHVLDKLNLRNRPHAVAYATRVGLI